MGHPVRRRVVMALMLLGNIGLVASAGSLIIGFTGNGVGHDWMRVVDLVIGLVAIVFVSRSAVVDQATEDR